MSDETQWDVFIGHAGPDKAAAEELYELLDRQCTAFLDSKSLRLGDNWDISLARAQRSARYSLILISAKTEAAYYQREEIAQAIALARKDEEAHRVVPIYLDGPPTEVSDVPYGLRLKHGLVLENDVTLRTVADRLIADMKSAGAAVQASQIDRIWNVPFRRNQFFLGRDDLLDDLSSRSPGLIPVVAVQGMGGVGKTELATEHAYRQRSEVDAVWWVRSESASLIASDLAALAPTVGVVIDPQSLDQTARNIVRWFETTPKTWLLIFDNAVDPDSINPWIPMSGNGQTIVTSRHPTWGEIADPIRVDVFEPEIATRYLLRRTQREDADGAGKLAEGLGYLALALNQAAGYLNQSPSDSFTDYLDRLEADGLHEVPASGARHEHTVATLWSESFARIQSSNATAAELLQLAALCGPEAIPLELFELPAIDQAHGWHTAEIDKALADLRGYSLVQQSLDATITVHRLVQLATRQQLDISTRSDRLGVLYKLLLQRFPEEASDPSTWSQCARYAPHIDYATGDATLGPLIEIADR